MKIKPARFLPIFLACLFTLGGVNSIPAQGDRSIAIIKSIDQLPGQRGLVVQASNTPDARVTIFRWKPCSSSTIWNQTL